jgi:hypothetical protein
MLSLLANIQLRSTIRNFGNSKSQQFIPWNQIQKIALIFNQNQAINKNLIDQFIHRQKKYFDVFYIEDKVKEASYADWQSIIKSDLNLLKLPKSTLLQNFHKKKYDLIINTCDEDDGISIAITAALKANFKCGSFENYNGTNLVIKKNEPFNLLKYLDEVIKYLKMIKN